MRKYFVLATMATASALPVFAEGEAQDLATQLGTAATTQLATLNTQVGPILVGAFVIAVGFVAYKLIKRAINKA